LSTMPFFKSPAPAISLAVESRLPTYLQPLFRRSMTTYTRVGSTVAIVQSFALLEVFHVLLGWVRSPLQTTVMQVSSRLWIVWGIAQQFDVVSRNHVRLVALAYRTCSGANQSIVHLDSVGVVDNGDRPLLVLRHQPLGLRASYPFVSPLHVVLRALPCWSRF
jgi:hypothetical protein